MANNKLVKKQNEYKEVFGEYLPLFSVYGMDEDEIIAVIDECIKNKKPYDPDIGDNVDI